MLERELERIAQRLSSGIVAALREASVDELADLIPAVRKLAKELERASSERARPLPAASKAPAGRAARGRAAKPERVERARPERPSAHLTDVVLKALSGQPGGLRSEEIQQKVAANARELRIALAELVESGQVVRRGQARGTRYSVPGPQAPSREGPASSRGPRSSRAVRAAREPREPSAPPPAVEVKVETVNDIRAHLANSVVSMTIAELEEVAKLDRSALKAVLDRMIEMGLVEREGHGPALRYRLATPSSGDGTSDANGPARIVRRPPRAKNWQPTPAEAANPGGQPGERSETEPQPA